MLRFAAVGSERGSHRTRTRPRPFLERLVIVTLAQLRLAPSARLTLPMRTLMLTVDHAFAPIGALRAIDRSDRRLVWMGQLHTSQLPGWPATAR